MGISYNRFLDRLDRASSRRGGSRFSESRKEVNKNWYDETRKRKYLNSDDPLMKKLENNTSIFSSSLDEDEIKWALDVFDVVLHKFWSASGPCDRKMIGNRGYEYSCAPIKGRDKGRYAVSFFMDSARDHVIDHIKREFPELRLIQKGTEGEREEYTLKLGLKDVNGRDYKLDIKMVFEWAERDDAEERFVTDHYMSVELVH